MMFPIDAVRARFPALAVTDNGQPRAYFDAPGGTQACAPAIAAMVAHLVETLGWAAMAQAVPVRCFSHEPSIKSSLTFLRRTPWARTQVEQLYLDSLKN